jgi:hypothetical protein
MSASQENSYPLDFMTYWAIREMSDGSGDEQMIKHGLQDLSGKVVPRYGADIDGKHPLITFMQTSHAVTDLVRDTMRPDLNIVDARRIRARLNRISAIIVSQTGFDLPLGAIKAGIFAVDAFEAAYQYLRVLRGKIDLNYVVDTVRQGNKHLQTMICYGQEINVSDDDPALIYSYLAEFLQSHEVTPQEYERALAKLPEEHASLISSIQSAFYASRPSVDSGREVA